MIIEVNKGKINIWCKPNEKNAGIAACEVFVKFLKSSLSLTLSTGERLIYATSKEDCTRQLVRLG